MNWRVQKTELQTFIVDTRGHVLSEVVADDVAELMSASPELFLTLQAVLPLLEYSEGVEREVLDRVRGVLAKAVKGTI